MIRNIAPNKQVEDRMDLNALSIRCMDEDLGGKARTEGHFRFQSLKIQSHANII